MSTCEKCVQSDLFVWQERINISIPQNWKPRVEYLGPSVDFVGENIPCRVEDCHDGTYDIIYVPTHPGG